MNRKWDSTDEAACREAGAIATMRRNDRPRPSRVRHSELRKGLEQVEARRRFEALFKREAA